MKFARIDHNGQIFYGIVEGNAVRAIEGDIFGEWRPTSKIYSMDMVRILPPCVPSKIIGIGLNYRDHAEEMGVPLPEEPIIFIKPSTSVIGHEDTIILPSISQRVDYEAELAAVIGRRARKVSVEKANEYILGYTCFNDITARDLQKKDVQFTRSKSFDTFSSFGPWIVKDINAMDLRIETRVNNEIKQSSRTSYLHRNVYELVSFVSHVMTLLPGDMIATGTPSGVGPLKDGDIVEVIIEGIGVLRNYVSKEE